MVAAQSEDAPRYDEQIEQRAVELLRELVADLHPYGSDGWDLGSYQRYQEALTTLTVVGALSIEQAQPWYERQGKLLEKMGGQAPPPEPEPEMPFVAGELSAVVLGPAERRGGLRVLCAELYADCVLVRLHLQVPEEPEDPVEARRLLSVSPELEDDRGTAYQRVDIPRSRGCKPRQRKRWPKVLVGFIAFAPPAPLDATTLTLSWREEDFVLPVLQSPETDA